MVTAQVVDPSHIKKSIADGKAVLVDVRESHEWDEIHIKDAHLLALSELRKMSDTEKLSWLKNFEGKTIYLHCRSGGRVIMAHALLENLYEKIIPLSYGVEKLVALGFEKAIS